MTALPGRVQLRLLNGVNIRTQNYLELLTFDGLPMPRLIGSLIMTLFRINSLY